ncbi:MAG TPA: META domain-containing protein [Rhodanobacteraceae bacterium]|nr:META domain-containing protein [Rhodanobacteraceae bacterium]
MSARLLVLVLAAALSACAGAGPQASVPGPLRLAGTQWRFVRLDGHKVPPAVKATLVFESNGHVSGRAGCNSYGGPWSASNGALHFGGMISTKMACLQPAGAMQAEQAVFAALREAVRAQMRDGRLILLNANGDPLALLQPQ